MGLHHHKATRVPADEVERVQANVARRQRHEIAIERHTAQDWRRPTKVKGLRAWTFERQAPRSSFEVEVGRHAEEG